MTYLYINKNIGLRLLFNNKTSFFIFLYFNILYMLTQKIITDIIQNNNLQVSYHIDYNNKIFKSNNNKIYPIHSISKFFTNIMLVLLYCDNIISDEDLHKPILLEKDVLSKLSKNVKDRLKNISLLQCIKHEAGLKDYLNKYHKELIKCYSNKYLNYLRKRFRYVSTAFQTIGKIILKVILKINLDGNVSHTILHSDSMITQRFQSS